MVSSDQFLYTQQTHQQVQNRKIKIHEKTIKNRTHSQTLGKDHLGPVSMTFKENIRQFCQQPTLRWQTIDHRIHMLWRPKQSQSQFIIHLFKRIQSLYILDGHHRTEGSLQYYKHSKQRAIKENTTITGKQDWQFLYSFIVPYNYIEIYQQRRILSFDQPLKKIQEKILGVLATIGTLKKTYMNQQIQKGKIRICFCQKCHYLINENYKQNDQSSVQNLDVYFTNNKVIQKMKQDFQFQLKYQAGIKELQLETNQLSIQFHPNSPEILFKIADQQKVMPAKATWIQPKPALRAVVRLPQKGLLKKLKFKPQQ